MTRPPSGTPPSPWSNSRPKPPARDAHERDAPRGGRPGADEHRPAAGARDRAAPRPPYGGPGAAPAPRHPRTAARRDAPPAGGGQPGRAAEAASPDDASRAELRIYGMNAVRAVFARRPAAIRKVYVAESRIPALQPLLKWCAANRVGYRVVDAPDLQKLAASAHHEGVVADVLREEPVALSTWLNTLDAGPRCALWLDGVGNPHNFGAILRAAAHFGVDAILLPKDATLALSGAAARVAEGGAEAVPLVRLGRSDNAMAQLRGAGFALGATVVDGGSDVFASPLPPRLVYVMGAEGEGMDRAFAQACDLRLSIPGSGAVESLNVASATAVFLAAWRMRHPAG